MIYAVFFPVPSSIVYSCLNCSNGMFSQQAEVTRGKRNCIPDDNLERETLLRKNKTLFVLKFKVSLPCISWSNLAIGILIL